MPDFINKAKETQPFNNGGSTVGKSGSTPVDGPQSPLSQTDQSDTIEKLESVDTASTSQIGFTGNPTVPVNPKDRENPDGSCKGAMTRGPSSIANPLTLQLDAAGRGSIAAYSPVVCDCYVPLNIPLLSLLGKVGRLGQLGGKFSRLARPLDAGHNALAMGMFFGIVSDMGDFLRRLRKTPKGKPISANEVLTQAAINRYLKNIRDIDISKFPIDQNFQNLASQLKRLQTEMAQIQGNIDRLNVQITQPGADRLYIQQVIDTLEAKKIPKQNEIDEVVKKITPVAAQLNLLEGQKKDFQSLLDAAKLALIAITAQLMDLLKASLSSDEAGVIFSAIGVPFDILAALDAQRPKVCLGQNTRLNVNTCECECVAEAAECQILPSFTWAVQLAGQTVWDLFVPVQIDELTQCELDCDCHLERSIPDCLCKNCESGYTWKSGKVCGCQRQLRRTQNRRGRKLPLVESGICIKDDVIAAQEAAGKSWDGTKSCSYICPEGSDVREGRKCGKFARLEDNLGNGAPSSSHYLYTTGCNCVCDGREAGSSDMISPWPPACPAGYVWDGSVTTCNCIPCPVKQYTCTDESSANSCDDCPEGYTCSGEPGAYGCSKVTEVGSAVESSEDCVALLGPGGFSGQWSAGWYCV